MLYTEHGPIETPGFMPVGTQATVKGLTPRELLEIGAQCVLANTYHLWLRPGTELIERLGGLHRFMGWNGPILTDSGGFQVLSLAALRQIDEQGVTFASHLDGAARLLTPELAMEVQAALGSDIAMALDVCPPYPCGDRDLREATERTFRWAERCLKPAPRGRQLRFGIVQGGVEEVLRRRAARTIGALPFDGWAIGGLLVGEPRERTWQALDAVLDGLPPDGPRYLMGAGAPADILSAISRGVDLFDSVLPTRLGRTGAVFTPGGRLNLRSAELARRDAPLDPTCDCPACRGYSVAYLHHLVRAREDLGLRLASLHNVRFLVRLAGEARRAILEGRFGESGDGIC